MIRNISTLTTAYYESLEYREKEKIGQKEGKVLSQERRSDILTATIALLQIIGFIYGTRSLE